ncbi:MAG: DDE-type integrase/transposase/recombinase [Firmicutes bacterium]|nr:DDE-type integrase/transposase/recombinase [Bacillota bacterium]
MERNLFVNEVLKMDEQLYRILWISSDRQYGYWISLGRQSRLPECFEYDRLSQAIQDGKAETADDPMKAFDGEAPESAKQKRDEWWKMLKPVLECEPDIYDRKKRGRMLSELSAQHNRDKANLYRYLQKYWKRGKTPNAFLQDYRNCGKGQRTRKGHKLGRPVVHEGGFGKILTDEDFRHFEAAVGKYYLNRSGATLAETYSKMLGDYYSVPAEDSEGLMSYRLLPEDQIPSITQLRYWYRKNRDQKKEVSKRTGEAKFELTGRAITGRSDYQLMGPGAKYQIDATVGDIYLVSQFDRKDIIGRPVMYFVVDSYSRIVTGMYVGLEGPSWAGAMMAIENAASDKVSYCAAYGITITEDEWPCHHVPTAILGDRGEMESRFADNLVKVLGVRIENAPPYRADMKGIIEQHFRTINTNATPFLPGKVLPDMSERGGHDYRLDAKLDIRQFTQIIIRCVLYYNNSHYMDYYEKNEQMMELGVDAIPLELWNFGIRYCSGSLRTVPRDVLRQALMPSDKASITDRGVKYKGLYYSSEEALAGLWFEKARAKGTYKARISYDPRDMGAILVEDPASKEMIRCGLVDWESKYAGKQQEEVWYEQEKEKSRRKKHTVKETEAKVNLGKQIESIVESAEKMAETDRQVSKAERVRNIRGNRKSERDEIRKQEAFIAERSDGGRKKQPVSSQEEELSPIMRMIQEQVEEEIKDDALYSKRTVPGTGDPGIPGESAD